MAALALRKEAFRLDGKLDDPLWAAVDARYALRKLGGKQQAHPATYVKIATDGSSLLIAFDCIEPTPSAMVLKANQDGLGVYHDDCAEVFLDCDGDQTGYYHFIATPRGFKGGEVLPGARLFRAWYDQGNSAMPLNDGWKTAGWIGKDRWTLEFQIPLELLGRDIAEDRTWRINFCRERRAGGSAEYSSWAYLPGGTFHAPQFFGTLRLHDDNEPVIRRGESRIQFWPRPKKLIRRKKEFKLVGPVVIALPQGSELSAPTRRAADALCDEINARFGLECVKQTDPAGAAIRVKLEAGWSAAVQPKAEPIEGLPTVQQQAYHLRIDDRGVEVIANHSAGLRYGIGTLRAILLQAHRPQLPHLSIEDCPDFQVRGLQLMGPFDLELFKRLVEVAELLKFNRLWLRMDNRLMIPALGKLSNRTAPTVERLKPVFEFARLCGLDVCPEQSLYSHANHFITNKPGFEDLGEGRGNPNLNIRHPRTRKILKEIVDTLVELFDTPKAFNVCHDELWAGAMGVSPETRGTTPADLLAESLNHWNRYLKGKGVRDVYVYGDPLKLGMGSTGGLPHNTYRARTKIDRDIVIVDWIYGPAKDYPTLDVFLKDGLRTVPATWYRPTNIQSFSRAALRRGISEFLATTWQQEPWILVDPELQQGIVLNGAYAWNSSCELDEWEILPNDYFKILWNRRRPVVAAGKQTYVDLKPHANIAWSSAEFLAGRRVVGLPYGKVISFQGIGLKLGDSKHAGIQLSRKDGPSCLPGTAGGIGVGRRARRIYFLQSASLRPNPTTSLDRRRRTERQTLAEYVVHYTDGTAARIPVRYRGEVTDWNDYAGCTEGYLALRSTTSDKASFQVYAWCWENPNPHKDIESLDIVSKDAFVSLVVLAITTVE